MADVTILQARRYRERNRYIYEGVAKFPTTASTGTLPLPSFAKVRDVSVTALGSITAPTLTSYHSQSLSGSVAATTKFSFNIPRTGTITAVNLFEGATVTANDTDYWTFGILDKTATTTLIDGTAAANSTKATGGASMAASTAFPLTITTAAVLANSNYELTATKNGSGTTLTQLSVAFTYTYTGSQDEQVYAPAPNATTGFFDLSSGKITISRNGTSLTSALPFRFRVEGQ